MRKSCPQLPSVPLGLALRAQAEGSPLFLLPCWNEEASLGEILWWLLQMGSVPEEMPSAGLPLLILFPFPRLFSLADLSHQSLS